MDKLCPLLLQTPLTLHPKPRTTSPTCSFSLNLTHASLDNIPVSIDIPASSSPLPSSIHGFYEIKTLDSLKAKHAQMVKVSKSASMAKDLITYYLQFGDVKSAGVVFLVGLVRNYAVWSSFLEELESTGGDPHDVLEVFGELNSKGVVFDSKVITVILKICTVVMDLWLGLEIHAMLMKRGFDMDVYLKSALIYFYWRCRGVECANKVFHEMPHPEDLLWNETIMLNLKSERWVKAFELFRGMQFSYAKPNGGTIVKMLQACGKVQALKEGKQIHGYVLKVGLESNTRVCSSLISMYSRNDKIELSRRVFDSMNDCNLSSWNSIITSYAALGYLNDAWNLFQQMEFSDAKPDIITWNCLLSGHALLGLYKEVLILFHRMQSIGFSPNSSSITSALQAVIELGLSNYGKEIHGYVIRKGLDYDVYVGTSLVDMYVKNNVLENARSYFDSMPNRNIFAWNSLISGYVIKGLFDDAKVLLNQMEEKGIEPDSVTWNVLVSGYSVWGHTEEALAVIDHMKIVGCTPSVISWTALISGCSQRGKYKDSLEFFIQMQQEGVKPNCATISSLLQTCGGLSLLRKGEEIHCLSLKSAFLEDVYVSTAVVDMYINSGNLGSALKVFEQTRNKTVASWNCMIMGFATYNLGKESISLFDEMLETGIFPDTITFTAVLSGCKNSGLVEEGWKYFDSMSRQYNIRPTIQHYTCMVDLLGRAGYLDEAWDFIQKMPINPDSTIWSSFLGSCKTHQNVDLGEIAAKKLFELEPYDSSNYVLMMNLYAMSNRWEDRERLKDIMDVRGVKVGHVWSWIEIGQTVHLFSGEEKPHQDEAEVFFELYQLVSEMKKLGYVPHIKCVYQNIDDIEKEKFLLSHTEKLAITYGLIKTKSSEPIRVIKNTRMCSDCHTAAKYMSLVRSREIFVRDGARFHHFKDGKCSCNDYW
ncbi:pentatricopeptide repeat-containing protein [Tripterygium wilfordii]|uniref:Pentatricopeptide repeat-containing protein n=1 Tax=Tripterygium wilfordii TaxID=458696 RepID=A0A7J7CGE4_TRIWF|nr:pentatricopeptide repeat-containing protein At4g01030, mitochondrial [Tripterygium wilfordii]KAF5733118.1 pentatricopeptide repeat-containing protein [Tripterygium wilfordii]